MENFIFCALCFGKMPRYSAGYYPSLKKLKLRLKHYFRLSLLFWMIALQFDIKASNLTLKLLQLNARSFS